MNWTPPLATLIVVEVMADLRNRKGILDGIEEPVQDEIAEELEVVVAAALERGRTLGL